MLLSRKGPQVRPPIPHSKSSMTGGAPMSNTSPFRRFVAAAALAAACSAVQPAVAQSEKPAVERLYVLNCGEGVAGDISRWSPGVNVGKSMDFVDNCYLIKHNQGWFLWDTGLSDAVAAMPDGLKPA